MAISDPRLSRVVSLKRQAAEAQYQRISSLAVELDHQIEDCEKRLKENSPGAGGAFSGDLLAAERYTQKLLLDLDVLSKKKIALAPELSRARFELQKIIVAEDVLDES